MVYRMNIHASVIRNVKILMTVAQITITYVQVLQIQKVVSSNFNLRYKWKASFWNISYKYFLLLKLLVTDEELKDITAELFRLIESPPVLDLDLHFQGKTQKGSTTDKAPEK